ncbi:MAG: type III-A CRISPR-associated protein Csm2 [Deltaproteobacteria bacterium]|nr:type III-A CRISPR-associated protein Csm2 [Deltaproteobacteria bacterium]RLB33311.1 MAG: type III-A CRISPR-associated protein Csm2 [Deltaproteobacteria bacterium]
MALPGDQIIKSIIDGDTKEMVITAKKLGKHLKQAGLTTSQIRNVFGSVKKMEMKGFEERELLLLKPKLAYAASRPGSSKGTNELRKVLSSAIDFVGNNEEKFENFCNFFEAILSYFRAAEKKIIR